MKSIIIRGTLLVCTFLFILSFSSCEKNSDLVSDGNANVHAGTVDTDEGEISHNQGQGFERAIHKHLDMQPIYLDDVQKETVKRPDGTVEEVFVVDGDIEMTKSQVNEVRSQNPNSIKQYRTWNLVSSPRTIHVIGYTGGSYALTSRMRTGLSWAIANYNALPIGLNFTLSFATSTNADIVVYQAYWKTGAGGSAGFPSGGNPYKWVQISPGTNSYSTNVNEHVIGHEIGHCIGMRHTDYFSRASCGQNSNEGSAGVGAVHIPGTPTGIDWNSLMLACFNSSEDGEFGYYDRVALQYLY